MQVGSECRLISDLMEGSGCYYPPPRWHCGPSGTRPVSRGLACCGLGGQEGTDLAFLLGMDLGARLTC